MKLAITTVHLNCVKSGTRNRTAWKLLLQQATCRLQRLMLIANYEKKTGSMTREKLMQNMQKKSQLREGPSSKRVVGQLGCSKSTPTCIYKS